MSTLTERRNGTRRSPNQPSYLRPEPFVGSVREDPFERELPAEARIELEEPPSRPVFLRPPEVFLRPAPPARPTQSPTYQPPPPPPEVVFTPPPVSPPLPSRPVQSAPRDGSAGWWILAMLVLATALLSRLSFNSQGTAGTQPQSRPTEVRRALPAVEVRRALPAGSVTFPVSAISNAGWQRIKMPDGEIVWVSYQGRLSSSSQLPNEGRFIGEE
jgi:hypothetical protein